MKLMKIFGKHFNLTKHLQLFGLCLTDKNLHIITENINRCICNTGYTNKIELKNKFITF